MADWRFRLMRQGDEPAVLSALQDAFGRWPAFDLGGVDPVDHLRWRLSSPGSSLALQCLAEVEGRVVGTHLHRVRRVRVRGRSLAMRFGTDSAVVRAYQGRGLYSALRAYRESVLPPFDVRMGFTSNALVGGLQAREGHLRFRNGVEVLVAAASPLAGGDIGLRLAPLFLWGALRRAASVGRSALQVNEVASFDGRVDELSNAAARQFDFFPERDSAFLNWRYCDAAAGPFTRLVAEEGKALTGYAVLRFEGRRTHVADILAAPGREDVAEALLLRGMEMARLRGAGLVECWLARRHPYRPALRRAGFVSTRRTAPLEFVAGGTGAFDTSLLADPTTLHHLTMGDTDAV